MDPCGLGGRSAAPRAQGGRGEGARVVPSDSVAEKTRSQPDPPPCARLAGNGMGVRRPTFAALPRLAATSSVPGRPRTAGSERRQARLQEVGGSSGLGLRECGQKCLCVRRCVIAQDQAPRPRTEQRPVSKRVRKEWDSSPPTRETTGRTTAGAPAAGRLQPRRPVSAVAALSQRLVSSYRERAPQPPRWQSAASRHQLGLNVFESEDSGHVPAPQFKSHTTQP